jgi:hypothetical protein
VGVVIIDDLTNFVKLSYQGLNQTLSDIQARVTELLLINAENRENYG